MPRIRNWQDLTFFRPDKSTTYKHIDSLFKDTIDWDLIKTHWKDIFQVVISIKKGKILPSTLLKKLNNKSRKNRLFHAVREFGMACKDQIFTSVHNWYEYAPKKMIIKLI